MCQMCDEYENELVRMGMIEDARTLREERRREHEATVAAQVARRPTQGGNDVVAHKARVK
jgi:hypothetical protein